MDIKDQLYDAFGELIYLMAMTDGALQDEEIKALQETLSKHEWSNAINWSFNYESKRKGDLEDTYKKVLFACFDIGPNPEYTKMIEVMEAVAASHGETTKEERDLVDRFRNDLLTEFAK